MCQWIAVVGAVPDNGGQVVTAVCLQKMQWQKEHGKNERANVTPYSRGLKNLYLVCGA